MIQVSALEKSYGDQVLFEGASFVINGGERIGLVGRNGSGKSTLLKLILDEEHPDKGTISYPRGYRIGRLSQHLSFSEKTILDQVCLGLPLEERDQRYRGEIILHGLGFSDSDLERAPAEFSGGFQIRLNLAQLLLSEPNLLLLDEPTNYLDIVSSRWLAETLRQWSGELIVITHDRSFMDSVTTHTMLIYRGGFRKIAGGTEKLFEAIALHEEVYEKTRLNDLKKRREIEQFVNRFRAQASKATLVQSRVKALEKMAVHDELTDDETLDFVFATKEFFGRSLLDLKDLSFGYSKEALLIKNLSLQIGKNDRIGIIGKNGRGKSTLLRLMASEISPVSGIVNASPNTTLGYFGQTNINRLSNNLTVEEEISHAHPGMHRTRIRGICGTMMFDGDKALKKISVLSGGERSRVLLGKIIAAPSNLLLLDEPTNHLDLDSVEALKDALEGYDGSLVLVTHNEMLLRDLCTRLVIFQGDAPFVFEGGYEYFLEKIGWEDEGGVKPSKIKDSSQKQEPSDLKQFQKKVRQLERTVEQLETKISKLETEGKGLQEQLDLATSKGDPEKIQELSMQLHEVTELVNKTFEEYTVKSTELSEIIERGSL